MFHYINLKRGYLPKVRNCFFTVPFKINRSILHFANQSVAMLNYVNLKDQRLLDIEKRATIRISDGTSTAWNDTRTALSLQKGLPERTVFEPVHYIDILRTGQGDACEAPGQVTIKLFSKIWMYGYLSIIYNMRHH
ncbi:hypothetical protein MKW98_032491 [Papaver atlanticum]|uniref:Uncharacterized protein n=1 Tax=Papaver atlanticum TaxID=357466 RepID=A0AAD4SXD6_9MAGN|nr:hypothetical protein MKW98_032491 [Papaver atlanticum]